MAESFLSQLAAAQQKLEELEILASDLEEQFVLGGGSGGQKINKTASCVVLRVLSGRWAGRTFRCQATRSLQQNRLGARWKMIGKIQSVLNRIQEEEQAEAQKEKRRNRLPSSAMRRLNVQQKRRRSQVKEGRQKPQSD